MPWIKRAKLAGRALVVLLALVSWAQAAVADDIRQYAQACAREMEDTPVQAFSCLSGTVIPMDGSGGTCEKPPYLPGAGCFPFSRIGQQVTKDGVGIVFLCRHKACVADENVPLFSDIAVIQTNFRTGATCFYQRLSDKEDIDGSAVPEPDSVRGAGFWMAPSVMRLKGNACVQCHDSGPFLRTPYVKQVPIDAFSHPRDKDKYHFPGNQFVQWNGRVYRIKIDTDNPGARCTTCHRMGNSDINPLAGTSTWLGLFSTGVAATPFLEGGLGPRGDLAVWMTPDVHSIDTTNQLHSEKVRDCADGDAVAGCHREPFDGQTSALLRQIEELMREVRPRP